MSTPMSEFTAVWNKLPYVTRHITALAALEFLLLRLFPWTVRNIMLRKRLPVTQPWMLVTSAFAPANAQPMHVLMTVIFLWVNTRSLEEGSRLSRSDLVFFLVFVQIGCIIVGPLLSLGAFLEIHTAAITYYCSQESPNSKVLLFGVVNIVHGLLPWANVAITFLVNGSDGAVDPLMGIFLGHLFIFLTELLPRANGPKLQTPELIKRWVDNLTASTANTAVEVSSGSKESTKPKGFTSGSRFGGQGHKLGK